MLCTPSLRYVCTSLLFGLFAFAQQPPAEKAPEPGSAEDFVKQGQKLSMAGKQDEALAMYSKAFDKAGDNYEAHLGAGMALDLKGDYDAAREHFNKAIDLASPEQKAQALRSMAFSYAFQDDGAKAAEYELKVFTARSAKEDFIGAAETCNETARIFLESGDIDNAEKWYKLGYDTVGRKSDLKEDEKNLWLFRWESAQARIAARRGKTAEAQQHVAAAKAALDKANNPDQARFFPYLTGYVAYYSGDYKTAIAELQKADQHDPLNLAMLGEAYEKSGDAVSAKRYYQKVLEINIHNPTNAFARPLAKKKLGL
jgi:tetratricopeptide (TPR) repeat protein